MNQRGALPYNVVKFLPWVVIGIETVALLIIVGGQRGLIERANRTDFQIEQEVERQVEERKKQLEASNKTDLLRLLQEPYRTHTAPDFFGAFQFDYPRFWAVYSEENYNSNELKVGVNPIKVVKPSDAKFRAALRVEILNRRYEDARREISQRSSFSLTQKLEQSDVSVSGINGTKFVGLLDADKKDEKAGILIILPYRNATLYIVTDDKGAQTDFGKSYEQVYNEVVASMKIAK